MQHLQLAIPEPCHENWQQMTPTEQGRFCNACAKEVIDFSTMTDIQVLNYFTSLTHEKVCGRALPEQLDRTISRPAEPKKKLFWYWNYIAMFFMFFTRGNNANAQTCTKPATELTPVKNSDVRGEVITMGGVKRDARQEVFGKVVDEKGTPIPYATISIKGKKTGVSSDSNGEFKINTEPNSVLVISAVGFKVTDAPVGMQREMKIILGNGFEGVLGGAVIVSNFVKDGIYAAPDNQKLVAMLAVKDFEKNTPIGNATIIVTKNGADKSDIFFTDAKGLYKIKGIKDRERYEVQIKADGYEPNEFTITAKDFKDRKKDWEVLLRKQKIENPKPLDVKQTPGKAIRIMGGVFVDSRNKVGLYVVDGTIMPNGADIDPADVEDYSVLDIPKATALFGSEGANGAIVITTRKSKIKKLDTVTVTGYGRTTGKMVCTSTSYIVRNRFTDTLKVVATKLTGAIKIYPNPVQRGEQFNIDLKLKQAGFYQILITDATGRILLQKQISANSKEVTEKILADSRWSSGTYYISITDNKNQLISKAGFIVQ